jgi:hypothetical protein
VSELLVGYARVSTDAQDLTAQRDGLRALGVEPERVYVDHGLTGTRDRPGLREALAACRADACCDVWVAAGLVHPLPIGLSDGEGVQFCGGAWTQSNVDLVRAINPVHEQGDVRRQR